MKRFSASLLALILPATLLVSCMPSSPETDGMTDDTTSSESSSTAATASVEGTLLRSGASIYMEGTHRLQMDDGSFLLLESSTASLDSYLNQRVIVTGVIRPTVEAGGMIMDVEDLEVVPESAGIEPEVLEEESFSSSMSSEESSSVSVMSSSAPASSSAMSSSSMPKSSSSAAPASSEKSSSAEAMSSSVQSSPPVSVDASAQVKAMAKASADIAGFNQSYCSPHIGFCVPYHRNWYYQSFGATVSPYLWHVEIGNAAVEEVGQGVIMINLVSGAQDGPEGVAVAQGNFVVASKAWTGNRHFEVSAPAELKAAVETMANGIVATETSAQ